MAQQNKRETFNLVVRKDLADQFEEWQGGLPGKKGEKIDGALMAILALSNLSRHLVSDLMRPDITVEQGASLIRKTLVDLEIQEFLQGLSRSQKAKILADARRYKDMPARRK